MSEQKLPQILCIHGMWSQAWVWQQWQSVFEAAGFKVITPNLRHHNLAASEKPPEALGSTSLRDYVDDLSQLISKLSEPPIVVGHSMGGLLAQMLAERGLAKAIILVNSAAPAPTFALRLKTIVGAFRPFLIWGFWRKPLRLMRWESSWLIFNRMSRNERSSLHNQLVAESGRAASELVYAVFDKHKAAHVDVSKIQCPVLAFSGKQDRIVPIGVSRKLAKRYQSAMDYRELPEHGHWLLGESGWQSVATQAADWAKQRS